MDRSNCVLLQELWYYFRERAGAIWQHQLSFPRGRISQEFQVKTPLALSISLKAAGKLALDLDWRIFNEDVSQYVSHHQADWDIIVKLSSCRENIRMLFMNSVLFMYRIGEHKILTKKVRDRSVSIILRQIFTTPLWSRFRFEVKSRLDRCLEQSKCLTCDAYRRSLVEERGIIGDDIEFPPLAELRVLLLLGRKLPSSSVSMGNSLPPLQQLGPELYAFTS